MARTRIVTLAAVVLTVTAGAIPVTATQPTPFRPAHRSAEWRLGLG
jgi:hypothetical protein